MGLDSTFDETLRAATCEADEEGAELLKGVDLSVLIIVDSDPCVSLEVSNGKATGQKLQT